MTFLTTEQVAEQAKLGEIPALECSWEHHHQGETASCTEIIGAIFSGEYSPTGAEYCACCVRFAPDAKQCPLGETGCHAGCCNGIWYEVNCAWLKFQKDYSNANLMELRHTEAKLCTYIKDVIAIKKAEKAVEPPLQPECDNCKHFSDIRNTACSGCLGQPRKNFELLDSLCKESAPVLDYSKAIIATKKGQPSLILVSNGDAKSYNIIGYDWVKLSNGMFNSCRCWETKEFAVKDYRIMNYNVENHNFSDLALYAEDLEEFEMESSMRGNKISICRAGSRLDFRLIGDTCNNTRSFTLDKATEIAHKILQEVATAKRRQNKK